MRDFFVAQIPYSDCHNRRLRFINISTIYWHPFRQRSRIPGLWYRQYAQIRTCCADWWRRRRCGDFGGISQTLRAWPLRFRTEHSLEGKIAYFIDTPVPTRPERDVTWKRQTRRSTGIAYRVLLLNLTAEEIFISREHVEFEIRYLGAYSTPVPRFENNPPGIAAPIDRIILGGNLSLVCCSFVRWCFFRFCFPFW